MEISDFEMKPAGHLLGVQNPISLSAVVDAPGGRQPSSQSVLRDAGHDDDDDDDPRHSNDGLVDKESSFIKTKNETRHRRPPKPPPEEKPSPGRHHIPDCVPDCVGHDGGHRGARSGTSRHHHHNNNNNATAGCCAGGLLCGARFHCFFEGHRFELRDVDRRTGKEVG